MDELTKIPAGYISKEKFNVIFIVVREQLANQSNGF